MTDAVATLIAAVMAACASMVGLAVNYFGNQRIAAIGQFADENREMRKRLRQLVELLHRAETSVRRLVGLAQTLDPEHFTQEATETLGIISDVFLATGEDRIVDYPMDVVENIRSVRKGLTELFLHLEFSNAGRANPETKAAVNQHFKALTEKIAECRICIRKTVTPKN